jgi:poly-gamma-glutamate biosynthesis protein PgsC/CapC
MPDYGLTTEVVRVALVAGVIVSMLFYERVHLTTGGAIVPAYLALALVRPVAVVTTVGAGFGAFVLVHKVVARHRIIYGRRRFELEVLVGLGLILMGTAAAHALGRLDPLFYGVAGIGFLIPGIIAHDMGRQGPQRTVQAVVVTTALLGVFVFVLATLMSILPGGHPKNAIELSSRLGYPREMLLLAVALSVLMGMFLHSRFGLRSGGFITGAYLALVSPRWGDIVFALTVAFATWWVVTRLLMPRLLLFGRRKLSTMILVGAIIGWSAELAILWLTHRDYAPWLGLTVATLLVPALIANDAERQGWERTLWGTTMSGVGVFAGTNLLAAAAIAGGLL